jgi:glutathione S-transferase
MAISTCSSRSPSIFTWQRNMAPGSCIPPTSKTKREVFSGLCGQQPKFLLPSVLVKFGIMSDAVAAKAAAERARTPLLVLDQHLKNRDWIAGSKFGIADLNVASVVAFARFGEVDIGYAPHVVAWLDRCLSRQTAPGASA